MYHCVVSSLGKDCLPAKKAECNMETYDRGYGLVMCLNFLFASMSKV